MKKGFTLMEVLGVIGLLGVLLLITVASYSAIVKNTKKDAYDRQVSTIIQMGKDFVLNNSTSLSKDSVNIITIEELLNQGYFEDKIMNPVTGEDMQGCVLVTWDSSYQQYMYEYSEDKCSN